MSSASIFLTRTVDVSRSEYSENVQLIPTGLGPSTEGILQTPFDRK